MLARGCSVEEAGNHICTHAEQMAEGVICSLVTVDREGRFTRWPARPFPGNIRQRSMG